MSKLYHLYYKGLTFRFLSGFTLFAGFTFLFSLYIFINLNNQLFDSQKLAVHFLNIGQGDSIYIQSPNKNSMLIDSGPQNEKVIPEVQKFKSFFDRQINLLLITHADADHIGSMKKVINMFHYQKFFYSGLKTDTVLFQDLMRQVDLDNDKKLVLTSGMSIIIDKEKNIQFRVLFPDFNFQIEKYKTCKDTQSNILKKNNVHSTKKFLKNKKNTCLKFLSVDTNLNSIVGILSYGTTSFLLTGDAPIEVEDFLINKNRSELQSTVLKLGHHGSKTSTSAGFLEATKPSFVVVSAGKDNRYGHPHKIVLDRVDEYRMRQDSDLKVLRTDKDGSISFYSDGESVALSRDKIFLK